MADSPYRGRGAFGRSQRQRPAASRRLGCERGTWRRRHSHRPPNALPPPLRSRASHRTPAL